MFACDDSLGARFSELFNLKINNNSNVQAFRRLLFVVRLCGKGSCILCGKGSYMLCGKGSYMLCGKGACGIIYLI